MDLGIAVVGLGPDGEGALPAKVRERLAAGGELYLRTTRLAAGAPRGDGFDGLFRGAPTGEVYRRLTDILLERARRGGEVVYAVPGSPWVGDEAVALLRRRARRERIPLELFAASGPVESAAAAGVVDPTRGVAVRDAFTLDRAPAPGETDLLVTQVHHRSAARQAGRALSRWYPPRHPVVVLRGGRRRRTAVQEVERLVCLDGGTLLFVPRLPGGAASAYPLDPLVEVMARLRGPEGCPWDREQTHRSLRPYVVEEAYEVVEAIDAADPAKLREELGDLLLQVVFHARLAAEAGEFTVNEVVREVVEKLVRRHPHVFGGAHPDLPWEPRQVRASGQVMENWHRIKEGEGERAASALSGVPRQFPALLRSQKLQAKAARLGFDWPDHRGALEKVHEELAELEAAVSREPERAEEELGDLLFAVVNAARLLSLDAEVALGSATDKFVRRFESMERQLAAAGGDPRRLSGAQWDELWRGAKKIEGNRGTEGNSANRSCVP